MKREEYHQLIDELLDGVSSEADFVRLEAEMHVNPEVRAAYYERLALHTALQIESENAADSSNVVSFPRWRSHARLVTGAAAAVLVLAAGSLGWKIGRTGDPPKIVKSEPVAAGFAVVAEESDAVWAGGGAPGRGDLLPQGLLTLASGMVQLEFFSGVTAIIEGEAEFEVLSAMEMSVRKGRMRASVPEPARGFRVRTASGDVVDLGTEFALEVTPDHADLRVLEGEVEWHPLAKPVRELAGGDAVRWTASGESAAVPASGRDAPGMADLQERLVRERAGRRAAWQEHSRRLREDPRLLVYFPMDQPESWKRRLADESGTARNGTIVRAGRVADRWGEPGGALDFSPTGSRVRLAIPGEHRSLTFYCWAKIDSLDRWYNSLFLTDGHDLNEPHWQIMDDGRLFFSVKRRDAGKNFRDKHVAYSPPFWTPALSGKWIQVATVFDVELQTTTHYVNGEVLSTDHLPEEMQVETVRIGAASIGNWSEPMREDPHFAVRNLNGAIDEFAIFGAALGADEIRSLHEQGRP